MARWAPAPLVGGAYKDDTRPFSVQDTVNWIPERAERPGGRSEWMLRDAPGARVFAVIGSAPIRGLHDCEGTLFAVCGSQLLSVGVLGTFNILGTIPGVSRVQIAHNQITGGNEVLIANGQSGYVYNTVTETLAQITDDAYPGATTVDYLAQVLVQIEPQRRFWFHSDLTQATQYISTDQYEAESAPDLLVALIASHGQLLALGDRTGEFYEAVGGSSSFFDRMQGTTLEVGCASAHAAVRLDSTVFWVGSDGCGYRLNGYNAQRITTHAIEQAWARCDLKKCFAFTFEDRGHKIAYFTFPDGQTWGYDVATLEWHRRQSEGLDRWRMNALVLWNGRWIGGDYSNGTLYELDWDYKREGCAPLDRERISGVLHDNQNRVGVNAVELVFDTGGRVSECAPVVTSFAFPDTCDDADYSQTLPLTDGTGPYSNPRVMVGAAPAGMVLSIVGNGVNVAFSNATAGAYDFWIVVDDALGNTSPPAQVAFTVHNFAITGSLPDGSDSVPYSELLPLSDGTAPYGTPTITAGALPTGGAVAVVGDSLRYTWPAAAAGTYNFTTSITDALGCTATSAQEVVIAASGAIACGVDSSYTGGQTYPTVIPITLGSATGLVNVTWGFGLPDKLEIWLDGILRLATGYQGHAASHTYAQDQTLLDAALDAQASPRQTLIYPETSPGSFYKGTATSVAEARVYGPIAGTAWEFNCGCPDTGVTSGVLTIAAIERKPKVGYTTPYAYATHGGTEPYTFSVLSGSLPTGRTLNATTGEETGTYTAAGTFTYTIRVTDAVAAHADVACSVVVVTNF